MQAELPGSSLRFELSDVEVDPKGYMIQSWVDALIHVQGTIRMLVDEQLFLKEEFFTFLELADALRLNFLASNSLDNFMFESMDDEVSKQIEIRRRREDQWIVRAARQSIDCDVRIPEESLINGVSQFLDIVRVMIHSREVLDLETIEGTPSWIH
ncbi:MAG: hypothetical protein NXH85_07680 [Pseudomonadaceae bacterium]|nr:hypothetical protein [Pseudomonadaceae bacterium]